MKIADPQTLAFPPCTLSGAGEGHQHVLCRLDRVILFVVFQTCFRKVVSHLERLVIFR